MAMNQKASLKILFVTPYPFDSAGSQRFRFEQYFPALQQHNIHFHQAPFWSAAAWKILYKKGKQIPKTAYLLLGIVKRFLLLFTLKKYDYIFIHRELFPVGPNFLIHWFTKYKVIYDFDDAIWLPNFAANNKRFAFLKNYKQVELLCAKAYKLSVGNLYLQEFAQQFNKNTHIIPTTIDLQKLHTGSIDYNFSTLHIGWTGTHSTMKYLPNILPVLDELKQQYNFKLIVISDKHPDFNREYLEFIPWRKETEIEDLKKIHIGLMPLQNDEWSRGKCGFKALQYMSIGMPAIVSPVGVNLQIVDHGINGFLCDSLEDWKKALLYCIQNPQSIKALGKNAQEKIEKFYSVQAITPKFIDLFKG